MLLTRGVVTALIGLLSLSGVLAFDLHLEARAAAPVPIAYEYLCRAIAFHPDGDFLACGAPHHANRTGIVYLFSKTAGAWAYNQTIRPDGLQDDQQFGGSGNGDSIVFHGDLMVVGAPCSLHQGSLATPLCTVGQIFTYNCSGAICEEIDVTGGGRTFGETIRFARNGTMLLVGYFINSGAVRVYNWNGAGWDNTETVSSPTPGMNYNFGRYFAVHFPYLYVAESYPLDKHIEYFEADVDTLLWSHTSDGGTLSNIVQLETTPSGVLFYRNGNSIGPGGISDSSSPNYGTSFAVSNQYLAVASWDEVFIYTFTTPYDAQLVYTFDAKSVLGTTGPTQLAMTESYLAVGVSQENSAEGAVYIYSLNCGGDDRIGNACDGSDSDLCKDGVFLCENGTVYCNDTGPGLIDVCNGLNDDCNNSTADGSDDSLLNATCTGNGHFLCTNGSLLCFNATTIAPSTTVPTTTFEPSTSTYEPPTSTYLPSTSTTTPTVDAANHKRSGGVLVLVLFAVVVGIF